MLGFSEIKGVDEGKERRGEVEEKGSKVREKKKGYFEKYVWKMYIYF